MIQVLRKSDYRRTAWKNGLGYTEEIAIFPEGAELKRGDFLWRVSSARIERASPFSAFPHHDRTLVILEGKGLRLLHDFEGEREMVEVPAFQPYDFPGDVPSGCELLAGPVTDLSVFVRKAEVDAVTEILELGAGDRHDWMPGGRWNFIHVAEGALRVQSGIDRRELGIGDSLRVDLNAPLDESSAIRLEAGFQTTRLVLVSLQG